MDRQPASGTAGLRIDDDRTRIDDAPLENDDVVDTGESKGNVAFCITLWLAGERFGASSAACAAASSQGWSTSPVKSGSLANDIDKALGPAFDDQGAAVDLYPCFGDDDSGLPAAVHPWSTYRRTAFDDYFASLVSRLDKHAASALVTKLGGAIPKNSGFNGMEGFPFHGIKPSYVSEGETKTRARISANTMLSGIGPSGELIPQFRRVGSMRFTDIVHYGDYWPFAVGAGGHPTEMGLWDKKLKDSLLDADVDNTHRGERKQLVHRTQPSRLMDYLVCLPYTAAWKLMNDRTPLLDGAQAAAELKRMFLHAYQDSDFPAFTDAQRAALDRQHWPENAYEAAAIIAAALVGFALEEGSLFDTTGRMLRRELGRQTAYLERLQDWASEITERDGASAKADRLQDVYVAPPFAEENPVNWLLSPDAGRRLLLQAGSGMGKSTFLRAAAAACASARLARISLTLDGTVANEEAARFALAFARGADNDAARFELRDAADGGDAAPEPVERTVADILSDDALARLSGMAQLSSFTPIVLSQTRDEALYQRLADDEEGAPSFSDLAFEALPETMRDALRSAAAAREGSAANPIDALVERGNVLLMVDSIDEIPRRHRALYLRRLREFADQPGIARLLVASRPLPPVDAAAMRGLLGRDAHRARLEEFDLPRQEELFARVTTRGGADAYDGPAFPLVCATAGFRGVMGNPFMLTAIALAFKRGRATDRRSVWGTFSEINKKFRKRTTLSGYDSGALEHLAFDLTVGSPTLPAAEFVERFRSYRNAEASLQARSAVSLELDEDELMDLIMSRLGIIDVRDGEAGFPYAAVRGFWASLWVRHCVERAQELPQSMMDMKGMGKDEREDRFEKAGNAGVEQLKLLLSATASADPAGDGRFDDAALLALLFTLDYAGTPSHPDYPAFDVLRKQTYRFLLVECLIAEEEQRLRAERALREAATFAFGRPLAGYAEETDPLIHRLAAFAKE